jgi:hypothetical protein
LVPCKKGNLFFFTPLIAAKILPTLPTPPIGQTDSTEPTAPNGLQLQLMQQVLWVTE